MDFDRRTCPHCNKLNIYPSGSDAPLYCAYCGSNLWDKTLSNNIIKESQINYRIPFFISSAIIVIFITIFIIIAEKDRNKQFAGNASVDLIETEILYEPIIQPTATIFVGPTTDPTLSAILRWAYDEPNWEDAKNQIGEITRICGPIVSANYASTISGKPTFLSMGNDYPNPNRVTIIIWGKNRANFGVDPEKYYLNKFICVNGLIESYRGVPDIEVKKPGEIRFQGITGW